MHKDFWKALFIRVAKTWCQTFCAVVGVDGGIRSFSEIDWKFALSAATVSAIICFFWNLGAGLPEVQLADTLYALDNDPVDEDEEIFFQDIDGEGDE